MIEKLKASKAYMAIVSPAFLEDKTAALQLGFAVLLDKPIFLLAIKGVQIPNHLVKIATCIERVNSDSKEEMRKAAEAFAERMGLL